MLVVVMEPGQQPVQRILDASTDAALLAALQKCVGGYIQIVPRVQELQGFDVFCNEDGVRLGLAYNATLSGHRIVGPILVSRADANGTQITLTIEEAERASEVLRAARGAVQ